MLQSRSALAVQHILGNGILLRGVKQWKIVRLKIVRISFSTLPSAPCYADICFLGFSKELLYISHTRTHTHTHTHTETHTHTHTHVVESGSHTHTHTHTHTQNTHTHTHTC